MKAIGNPRLFLSCCLCASKTLCIGTEKNYWHLRRAFLEKLSSSNIFSSKRNRIDFFNFFLNFFFSFLLSGKSGCFLISEVKLGLRDRSSPSRDADIGKEQEELGKLPLDLIRLRRVLLRCCKHQSSGKGVKKPPFLYWTPGRWQMNCSWSFDSKGDEKRKRGAITYRD